MASKYVKSAKKTLDPLFAQQTTAVKQQIPAIQQLYDSLTQGLQQQSQGFLESGVTSIGEDAIGRGISRSSIPVDARTSLTKDIGSALTQGLAQLGSERTRDVAGVRKSLADIGLQRSQSITSLADQLQAANLREREFILRKREQERAFQLEKQRIALSRAQANTSSAVNALISKIGKSSGLGGGLSLQDIIEYLNEFRASGGIKGSTNIQGSTRRVQGSSPLLQGSSSGSLQGSNFVLQGGR